MDHYAAISSQIRDLFMEFTPEIEPIALDEAFLDITHSLALFGEPIGLAERLKRRVRAVTRLTVSVGIASNKLIAKIACTSGKPDGLVCVPLGAERDLLEPMPVRRLWGIGPVSAAALERRGILTVGQLARCRASELAAVLGSRADELVAMANGRDPRAVQPDRDPKSYGEESTFERDLLDGSRIEATITAHSEAVARRLRHDTREGRTVTLKIKSSAAVGRKLDRNQLPAGAPEYPQLTRSRTLPHHTSDGGEIRRVALELWTELNHREPIRLLGVSVSGIRQQGHGQLELFETKRPARRLGAAMDAIESRFGRGAIRRGAEVSSKLTPSMSLKRGE